MEDENLMFDELKKVMISPSKISTRLDYVVVSMEMNKLTKYFQQHK